MKVLHYGSLDTRSGGPALSTYLTLKGLIGEGVEAQALCHPLSADGHLIGSDVNIHFTKPVVEPRFGYIPQMDKAISAAGPADIYHVQGLWQYPGHSMAKYARRKGKPYIITLRGMLYPQALAHSAMIKRLSLALYQRKDLEKAAAIQCTCKEEMDYYRQLGFTNPVAIIPNPIEMPKNEVRVVPETFNIGYLGRLHPRKRVERLIYALSELPNAHLTIIGGGDKQYEQFLQQEVARLQLTPRVHFAGFLNGEEKATAVRLLSVLAVPSDFENFGNIVTEALAHQVPVIASTGMPWQILPETGCGWWVDNDQDSINRTLALASKLSADDLLEMGRRGRTLVEAEFSVESLGKKMAQLYEWILNGGDKPDFVYL